MANDPKLPPHIQIKNIVEIGELFNGNFANHMKFISDDYLLDADVLIISIRALQLEFSQLMGIEDIANFYMPREKFQNFEEKMEQRKKELQQYLERGGVLFVFMDNDPLYSYKLGNGESSENKKLDFRDIITLNSSDYKTETRRGTNILFTDAIYQDFFHPWDVSYHFIYNEFKGVVTAKVKNTNQAISIVVPKGKGLIFLLPELKLSADDYDEYENRLYDARIAILNFVWRFEDSKPHVQDITLPEWCADYYLGYEIKEMAALETLQIELAKTQQKIIKQQEQLAVYQPLKQMLSGTGKTLEGIVELILEELGFEFMPTEPGRDDLIIKAGDQVGVVEIKGVKGSATEQNATQLMKWVTNFHHENHVEPKGILIVNAFKELPPSERKQDAFPHQMLTYSNRMQFCLLTTYQLLGLFLDFKTGDLSFHEVKNILFETVGRLNYMPSKILTKEV